MAHGHRQACLDRSGIRTATAHTAATQQTVAAAPAVKGLAASHAAAAKAREKKDGSSRLLEAASRAAAAKASTREERRTGRPGSASRAGLAQAFKPRTDVLDRSPNRARVASPVKAPLVFPRPELPAAAGSQKEKELHTKHEARQVKRREEQALWEAYFRTRGGQEARNALWVHYQGLVRYIAERQKRKLPECIDAQDLVGAGNLGLLDAIGRFDPTKCVRFETFCVPRIRGAMVDSIRAADWVPRLIRNKGHQFDRLVAALGTELGREPTEEEIAGRLNMDLRRLGRLRKELDVKAQISIEGGANDRTDPRDLFRLTMFPDREVTDPTWQLQREEIRAVALRGLSPNERWVVEQYYFNGRSMKDIGDDLCLSESRICQIHTQVLEVLRRKFRAYRDSCYL